jgi:hypothetical protein
VTSSEFSLLFLKFLVKVMMETDANATPVAIIKLVAIAEPR